MNTIEKLIEYRHPVAGGPRRSKYRFEYILIHNILQLIILSRDGEINLGRLLFTLNYSQVKRLVPMLLEADIIERIPFIPGKNIHKTLLRITPKGRTLFRKLFELNEIVALEKF